MGMLKHSDCICTLCIGKLKQLLYIAVPKPYNYEKYISDYLPVDPYIFYLL
jgi:hypothetical protein